MPHNPILTRNEFANERFRPGAVKAAPAFQFDARFVSTQPFHNDMNTKSEYVFTEEQFNALPEEERRGVLAVLEYQTSSTIDISDEQLSER